MDVLTDLEFAVNMSCSSCEKAVRDSLKNIKGIESISVDVTKQMVLVKTTQPSSVVQGAIESTGMLAVLRGVGQSNKNLGAAVSILKGNGIIYGLVRFTQTSANTCVVDGSFNGLTPGKHGLHVHELGDLSDGCNSTGDDYNPYCGRHGDRIDSNRHAGDLGNIVVDSKGNATLRFEDNLLKVHDLIGRAMVVHEREDDLVSSNHGNSGKGIACGVIARSAGLFENTKKVCTCNGKTLWQERVETREDFQLKT